jgi:hypothetical protein
MREWEASSHATARAEAEMDDERNALAVRTPAEYSADRRLLDRCPPVVG